MFDNDIPNLPARLPSAVREKLLAISDVVAERNAALRSNSEQMRAISNELLVARGKLWNLERQGTKNDGAITQLRDQIVRDEATVAAISSRQERTDPHWRSALALNENLVGYVRTHAAGGFVLYEGPVPVLRSGESASEALERAARRTRTLQSDRREVLAAPFPSDMAKKIAWEGLQARAEAAKPDVSPALDYCEPVRWPTSRAAIEQHGLATDLYAIDVIGILTWLDPGKMRAAIEREIDAAAEDEVALSATTRVEKLAIIDSDLLWSQREEAAFAELAGLLPRADIDPRAALGLADTMPAPSRG